MLKDIVRFSQEAVAHLENGELKDGVTLGKYLAGKAYGKRLASHYPIPIGSAI